MLIVKKFGGTSVANKERIFNVARRCIEDYKKGNDVVVVLSAMGKYTDELITMAKDINDKPPKREMDMLFTIGEQMSVALMAMAMDSLGVPSVSLNAFQVAMHTTSAHSSARLKKIDAARIRRELDNRRIVVVTGFQGIDKYNDYTTLGRGGSDTTAVALAAALHADACEIYTMWMAFILLTPVRFRKPASLRRSLTMRCWIWQLWVRECFITVLWRWQRNTACRWWYVPVSTTAKELW